MTGVRLVTIPQNLNLTTLALGGASIGSDALAVTGTSTFNGNIALTGQIVATGSFFAGASSLFTWNTRGIMTSPAAGTIQYGSADVDTAPVAQTLRTQGTLAGGTSNVAGANTTWIISPSKGNVVGGSLIIQTTPAGSTGSAVNAPVTALTIDSTQLATFAAGINSVGSHTFTTATSGIVLKRGANGLCGTFVANGITPVTVSNSNVAITDAIIISLNTVGGTVGVQPHVATITGASGFTVVCTATDTSTYNYALIKNAA